MVDPINGLGPIQNVKQFTKSPEKEQSPEGEAVSSSAPRDEVSLSPEAVEISVTQAEESAVSAANALKENKDFALGLNPNFDETV